MSAAVFNLGVDMYIPHCSATEAPVHESICASCGHMVLGAVFDKNT